VTRIGFLKPLRKPAVLVKISVALSWNFSWKVFAAGQMFTRLTWFQNHWPALNWSGLFPRYFWHLAKIRSDHLCPVWGTVFFHFWL